MNMKSLSFFENADLGHCYFEFDMYALIGQLLIYSQSIDIPGLS